MPDPADPPALPPYLVAGNRFGSAAVGTGLAGLLLALAPFGHALAWPLAAAAAVLGTFGYARYTRGSATNRDASVVGQVLGWVALGVLFVDAQIVIRVPSVSQFWVP